MRLAVRQPAGGRADGHRGKSNSDRNRKLRPAFVLIPVRSFSTSLQSPAAPTAEGAPTSRLDVVPAAPPNHLAGVAAWAITVGLIVYLGLKRGGYPQPVYSEIGIAAWWLVGIGTLAGALSTRIGRAGWIALGLLAAFAGWTAIGVIWSESSGRSVVEVARVLAYAGVFAMALLLAGRDRARLILGAVATGIAAIAVLALLSRLQPGWFPENRLSEALVGVQSRLAYPVGYWNALAGLIAIGLPLLLWGAVASRSSILRGLAAAAVPAVLLASYFTYSRAGIVGMAVAVIALVALSKRRLSLAPPLGVMGLVSGALIWLGSRRGELADGLTTETAMAQGDTMLAITAGACLLSGLAVAALAQGARRGRIPEAPVVSRPLALRITAAVLVIGVVAFVAVGGPAETSDAISEFKDPAGLSDTSTRLSSFGGNGRWQYWTKAVEANATAPLIGIGPGTYVFWWSANRDIDNGLVRDAHSLYIETLGELGIVGLVLVAGFILFVLVVGGGRALEAVGERRLELAAGTAAALAFAVAAGLDWLWELAVVPVAFFLVAATVLRSAAPEATGAVRAAALGIDPAPQVTSPRWRSPFAAGAATMLVALASIFVIYATYESDLSVAQSQEEGRAGDLDAALEAADRAIDLQPFAGEPLVQRAFVLEARGELAKAAAAAREATEAESTNWENWYALAKIQRQRGKEGAAILAFRRAQELNPISQVLNPIRCGRDGELCEVPAAP